MAGLQLSKADVVRMREKAERLQSYAKRTMEKSKAIVHTTVRTVEVTAAAFGWGIVKGRWGEVELFGAPLSLVGGLGLHLLGFFGVAGDMSSHLHAFADGSMASWATTTGVQAGDAWKTKQATAALKAAGAAAALPGAKTSGALDAELARAVAGR